MMYRKICICALAAGMIAGGAVARQADGTLGLIETPNSGVPAIVLPGGAFECTTQAQAALKLVSEAGTLPLETSWKELPGGRWGGSCTVPANAAPGAYALEAAAGDARDQTLRAVYVRAEFPEYYVIAHLSDVHIGKERPDKPLPLEVFKALIAALNGSEAAFAVITGDLTETGSIEQYQQFLATLDTCAIPTFVQPGNHDREKLNYEHFFGPTCYRFRFNRDGYLAFDTKDFVVADGLDKQDGDLEVYRRQLLAGDGITPSRWSIGLTHRYEPMMGIRSQLALFVDTPLDWLLVGHWHRENTKEEAILPWGNTRLTAVPAAVNGQMRHIDVTDGGLLLREVEQVVPMP